jgi:hypothetical protein
VILVATVHFNFEDNRVEIEGAMDTAIGAALLEASAELVSQTARNTRVDTGQLKGSWTAHVEENVATIGSPLENAIWEEFGTGEYALNGNGRKGGWAYEDPKTGETVWTRGKRPTRAFWNAYTTLKPVLIKHMKDTFGVTFK